MPKDTFYFSHDYNARTDNKIMSLIFKHGMLGYGIYWAVIECLYQNDNEVAYDLNLLSFELRVDEVVLKSVLNDFGLFIIADDKFSSASVARRLETRETKSKQGQSAAGARWGKNEARIKAKECILYVLKIFSDTESFLKVGITSESIARRYSGKLANYRYEVLYQCEMNTSFALSRETRMCELFAKYPPNIKFPGSLECFKIEDSEAIIHFAMHGTEFRNAIKESKGKESKGKDSVWSEISSDEKLITDLKMNYPHTNLIECWGKCYRHWSVQPNPPEHIWQWKQKFSLWVSREYMPKQQNKNGQKKGEFVA